MVYQQYKRAIGTFPNRQAAEEALRELKSSGFPMDRVSVLAKDADRNDNIAGAEVRDRGETESQEGAGIGAVTGTLLGGMGGLLVGLEALLIPGVGPFLAAGTIATTLAGAGIGAASGAIIGALTGLGIPEEEARDYSDRVSQGEYLVLIEGTETEIQRAAAVLSNHGIRQWRIYDTFNERDRPVDVTSTTSTTIERDRTQEVHPVKTTTDEGVVEIVDKRDRTR
jgi:uncharacterized membrane protein